VDCTFIDNRHYGAWFYEGSPSITRCTFSDNAAYPLLLYDSAGTVTDCVMTGNASVGSGGGLYAIGSNTIAGCTISGNRASYGAGGVYVEGGTVVGCTISNNKSGPGWAGGGGEIDGADVIDCRFSSNESAAGGGLYVSSPGTTLTGCTFEGNTALSTGGGGVWCRDFDDLPTHLTQFVNCLFIGNAGEEGGGLLTWGWSPIVLVNCTFSGNAAASGGAVYFDDHQDSNMINCVLWGDIPDEIGGWSDPGNAAAFSDVQGGYPGPGNIDADPLFVDPAAGDYRLGPGSPCIDAGRSQMIGFASTSFRPGLCDQSDLDHDGDTHELIPVDREGQARFADDPDTPDTGCAAGPVVDMGAYEFGDSPPGQRVLHADLDGDGEVGVADFLIVLGMWGPCADPCCLADLATHYDDCRTINTPDGDVDVGDFYALLSWWGF
jgi:parallel beta-helix repeat protein